MCSNPNVTFWTVDPRPAARALKLKDAGNVLFRAGQHQAAAVQYACSLEALGANPLG